MNITISFPDAVIKDNLIWKSHPPGKKLSIFTVINIMTNRLHSPTQWFQTRCHHYRSVDDFDGNEASLSLSPLSAVHSYHQHLQFTNAALSQVCIKTVSNLVPGCCRAKKLALRDIFTFCNCCCFPWICSWTILAISCKCAHFTWESKSIECFVSVLIWLWEDCCGCGVDISCIYILF